MKRVVYAMILTAAILVACQERYLSVDDAGRKTAAPPSAMTPAAGPRAAPTVERTPRPAPAGDTCDAASLTYLIGKPRLQIPVSVDLTRRRVVCATCDRPPDVDPRRATILFDAASGLVTEVRCE